jgi:hypothetical protein
MTFVKDYIRCGSFALRLNDLTVAVQSLRTSDELRERCTY